MSADRQLHAARAYTPEPDGPEIYTRVQETFIFDGLTFPAPKAGDVFYITQPTGIFTGLNRLISQDHPVRAKFNAPGYIICTNAFLGKDEAFADFGILDTKNGTYKLIKDATFRIAGRNMHGMTKVLSYIHTLNEASLDLLNEYRPVQAQGKWAGQHSYTV